MRSFHPPLTEKCLWVLTGFAFDETISTLHSEGWGRGKSRFCKSRGHSAFSVLDVPWWCCVLSVSPNPQTGNWISNPAVLDGGTCESGRGPEALPSSTDQASMAGGVCYKSEFGSSGSHDAMPSVMGGWGRKAFDSCGPSILDFQPPVA
jgi:hypothetical protein